MKQQFDLKSQESQLLSDKLKQSSHGQQLEDIKSLQKEIGKHSLDLLCLLTV